MPDFSPWGAAAQSGMGGYQYPQPVSGVAAGSNGMPQMNQGLAPGGFNNYSGGIGPALPPPSAPMGQGVPLPGGTPTMGGFGGGPAQMGAPGINGGRFGPMGQPTGIGQGGMNPLMGFLLPFLMQRMGVGGAQGGVFNRPPQQPTGINAGGPSIMNNPQMNGQLGSVGAPQVPFPGGSMGGYANPYAQSSPMINNQPPQRILQGGPPAPPMQTKSPFDMQGVEKTGGPNFNLGTVGGPVGGMPPNMGNFGPAMNAFLPPSMGGQAQGLAAPPPQRIMQGEAGPGKTPPAPPASPPMSPEAQMQQQAQQMELNRSLSNMGINNPMGAQMANLLRQQLMGQLGY